MQALPRLTAKNQRDLDAWLAREQESHPRTPADLVGCFFGIATDAINAELKHAFQNPQSREADFIRQYAFDVLLEDGRLAKVLSYHDSNVERYFRGIVKTKLREKRDLNRDRIGSARRAILATDTGGSFLKSAVAPRLDFESWLHRHHDLPPLFAQQYSEAIASGGGVPTTMTALRRRLIEAGLAPGKTDRYIQLLKETIDEYFDDIQGGRRPHYKR